MAQQRASMVNIGSIAGGTPTFARPGTFAQQEITNAMKRRQLEEDKVKSDRIMAIKEAEYAQKVADRAAMEGLSKGLAGLPTTREAPVMATERFVTQAQRDAGKILQAGFDTAGTDVLKDYEGLVEQYKGDLIPSRSRNMVGFETPVGREDFVNTLSEAQRLSVLGTPKEQTGPILGGPKAEAFKTVLGTLMPDTNKTAIKQKWINEGLLTVGEATPVSTVTAKPADVTQRAEQLAGQEIQRVYDEQYKPELLKNLDLYEQNIVQPSGTRTIDTGNMTQVDLTSAERKKQAQDLIMGSGVSPLEQTRLLAGVETRFPGVTADQVKEQRATQEGNTLRKLYESRMTDTEKDAVKGMKGTAYRDAMSHIAASKKSKGKAKSSKVASGLYEIVGDSPDDVRAVTEFLNKGDNAKLIAKMTSAEQESLLAEAKANYGDYWFWSNSMEDIFQKLGREVPSQQ